MLGARKLVVGRWKFPVQLAGPVPAPPPTPVLAPGPEEVCCSSLLFLRDVLFDRVFGWTLA